MRALGGPAFGPSLTPQTEALLQRFAAEHDELRQVLAELRATADLIATTPDHPGAAPALAAVHRRLVQEILPHEHAEERRLYPALATPLGSEEATATMSRAHIEIDRLAERIGTHVRLAGGGLVPRQIPDLLASLYGLDAVLRLHFSQEEEHYFALTGPGSTPVEPVVAGAPAAVR
ncbi:MAG TPA: hemerythrin domain-containing protein [Micromonosporaceae bacterium]